MNPRASQKQRFEEAWIFLASAIALGGLFGSVLEMGMDMLDWTLYCFKLDLPFQNKVSWLVETVCRSYSRSFWKGAGIGLLVGAVFGGFTFLGAQVWRTLYRPVRLGLLLGEIILTIVVITQAALWYDNWRYLQKQTLSQGDVVLAMYGIGMATLYGLLVGWTVRLLHRCARRPPPGE